MRLYKPSGKLTLGGLIMLILAVIVSGALVGGIAFAIEYFTSYYLICIFPLVMGFLGGGIIGAAVKLGKVRNPLVAGLFGLLAGVAAIGVYHFAGYAIGFHNVYLEMVEDGDADPAIDQELVMFRELTTEYSFVEYMDDVADEGVGISYRSTNIHLNDQQTWIYWGIEVLIIAVIAIFYAGSAAGEPFDEAAGKWFDPGEYIASVPWNVSKQFQDSLKSGNYRGAGAMMTTMAMAMPRIDVNVRRSSGDSNNDMILNVQEVKPGSRGSTSTNDILTGVVSPQEFDDLQRSISRPALS